MVGFEWITDRGVLGEFDEEEEINLDIFFTSDDPDTELSILSGKLPDGLTFEREDIGHYVIDGTLPTVSETTFYDFTVRATVNYEKVVVDTIPLCAYETDYGIYYTLGKYDPPTEDDYLPITTDLEHLVYAYDVSGKIIYHRSEDGYDFPVYVKGIQRDGKVIFSIYDYIAVPQYMVEETQDDGILIVSDDGLKVSGFYGTRNPIRDATYYIYGLKKLPKPVYFDQYFTIIVDSYSIDWLSPALFATTTEYAYFSEYFKLKNPNGNERFVKISGELPEGLQINKFGLCYGTIGKVEQSTDYRFRIGVYVDGEQILWKDFIITVKTLAELNQPIWITQEGNVGKLNYRDKSNIKINVYEPNNLPLEFTIIYGGLPTGLTLNSSNGSITGTVATENQVKWDFTISCTNGFKTIERTFNIVTNEVDIKDGIKWITDEDLGSVLTGGNYYNQILTESNYPVVYDIVSGSFPSGIEMSRDGLIYGNCNYQELKKYSVTIHAKNEKTEVLKTFYLEVKKGLGQNAMRSYFYINLEHIDEYELLKTQFDSAYTYNNYDKNFNTTYKPEIYVADLNCYDKPLLQTLLQYNTYLMLTGNKTKCKNVMRLNSEGEEEHAYDVFYKDFKTSNDSPDEEYINYPSQKHYIKRKDGIWVDYYSDEPVVVVGAVMSEEVEDKMLVTYQEMAYEVGYIQEGMYYTEDDKTVVFGNPEIGSELQYNPITQKYDIHYYYMDGPEKIYVIYNDMKRYYDKTNLKVLFDIDVSIYSPIYTTKTMYFYRDANIVYVNIPSIDTMRKRMATKIYVRELNEDNWYDINTEEILNPKYDKPFELKWDDEVGSYYFYMDQMPYVQLVAYDDGRVYEDRNIPLYCWNGTNIVGSDDEPLVRRFYLKENYQTPTESSWETITSDLAHPVYIYDEEGNPIVYTNPATDYKAKMYVSGIYSDGKLLIAAPLDALNNCKLFFAERDMANNTSYTERYGVQVNRTGMNDAVIYDDEEHRYWTKVYIYDEEEFGNIYAEYKYYDVINATTHRPYRNVLFTKEGIPYPFMIDNYGKIRFCAKTNISERKWYWFDKTINSIESNNLILPYINEEDIQNDGQNYIQMFNPDTELLPEWMEGKYIPKFEVFYSEPGKNYSEWQNVLAEEEQNLAYFYKKDLSFYCLTLTPKYNMDIRPSDIHFDYHTNPYTPHTLIPTHSN